MLTFLIKNGHAHRNDNGDIIIIRDFDQLKEFEGKGYGVHSVTQQELLDMYCNVQEVLHYLSTDKFARPDNYVNTADIFHRLQGK